MSKRCRTTPDLQRIPISLSALTAITLWLGVAATAVPAAPLRTIQVAIPGLSISYLPFILASEQGMFQQEGLAVRVIMVKARLVAPTMQSGGAGYSTAFASVNNAAIAGIPIKNVMAISDKLQHVFLARAGIRSMSELSGKRVGINSFGELTDIETRAVLQAFKVPLQSVQFIELGGASERVAALEAGYIDATAMTIPINLTLEQRGFVRLLRIADHFSSVNAGWATTVKKIKEERDEVKKTLRAILRGVKVVKADKAMAIRVMADYFRVKREIAGQAYDLVRDTYSDTGNLSDEMIRTQIGITQTRFTVKKEVLPEVVFDRSLIEEVYREVQEQR